MAKSNTTISIDSKVFEEARAKGLVISQVCEQALRAKLTKEVVLTMADVAHAEAELGIMKHKYAEQRKAQHKEEEERIEKAKHNAESAEKAMRDLSKMTPDFQKNVDWDQWGKRFSMSADDLKRIFTRVKQ